MIGGVTPACLAVATALYSQAIHTIVPVSAPAAAEMTKLLENTFRAVNIALVNEVAIMCDKLGLDVWEVVDAAATKPYGYMKFTPGPGVGGHLQPPMRPTTNGTNDTNQPKTDQTLREIRAIRGGRPLATTNAPHHEWHK